MLPLPFESLRWVNAYLITGEQTTLVDCGIHDPASDGRDSWDALEDALAACDVSLQLIHRVVVTHPHVDHYGMAARLARSTGVELWMHEAAPEEIARYERPDTRPDRLREMLHPLPTPAGGGGSSDEDWRRYLSGIVYPSHQGVDGESFTAGARTWRIVHTPGHSRSHVCLWSEADGLLISGDHLLGAITPHVDAGDEKEDALGDYLESLYKVERLAPAVVLPGHGRPFQDGAERARAILRHHDRRLGAILQVLRHRAATLAEVSEQIFGSPELELDQRLALSEALAHLDHLERLGEVERVRGDDGAVAFRKARRERARGQP